MDRPNQFFEVGEKRETGLPFNGGPQKRWSRQPIPDKNEPEQWLQVQ
jgi:hypothetical protein